MRSPGRQWTENGQTEAWVTAAFRERAGRGMELEGEVSHIWEVEEER